jgi:hypothetical protein
MKAAATPQGMTAALRARSSKVRAPPRRRPARRAKKKPPRGSRAGFDLLQLQFCSVIRIYPIIVTMSSIFYRSGQFLHESRANFHKTAISGAFL